MDNENIIRYTTPTFITVYRAEETSDISIDPPKTQTVDNLYLDKDTNSIYLTSNGETVGTAIPINDLSNAIVDSSNDGLVAVITD